MLFRSAGALQISREALRAAKNNIGTMLEKCQRTDRLLVMQDDINELYKESVQMKPDGMCPMCVGAGCEHCEHRGFILKLHDRKGLEASRDVVDAK